MTHLLLETSGHGGLVGLVRDHAVVQAAALDESRRHARDLAETVRQLCTAERITPKSIASVVVSLGPGSYTGLRVGLASAKAFAYAVGCPLVAVPTFSAIIEDACKTLSVADIAADALQGAIYLQRFHVVDYEWQPADILRIVEAKSHTLVNGVHDARPTLSGLWWASLKVTPLTREAFFNIEPLYLRGSSAEEKRSAQSLVKASIAS